MNGGKFIRPIEYRHARAGDEIDVFSVASMRARARPDEFVVPQRLSFDLVLAVTAGETTHTVDFTSYPLAPGDVVRVRAGQVQQWGDVKAIDGVVVLFLPYILKDAAWFITPPTTSGRVLWQGAATAGSQLRRAINDLARTPSRRSSMPPDLHRELTASHLQLMLVELSAADSLGSDAPDPPVDELYRQLLDAINERFATMHRVAEYARLLNYSSKTLNRLAQTNAGLTAKQVIDQRIMLEAKRLLAHNEEPLYQVASSLGFSDAARFTKFFGLHAGMAPSRFRSSVRRSLS